MTGGWRLVTTPRRDHPDRRHPLRHPRRYEPDCQGERDQEGRTFRLKGGAGIVRCNCVDIDEPLWRSRSADSHKRPRRARCPPWALFRSHPTWRTPAPWLPCSWGVIEIALYDTLDDGLVLGRT